MSKKFFIILAVLVGIVASFYAYLGGFNTPQIVVTTSDPMFVAGKYYEGPADEKAFGEIFEEIGQAVEKKIITGTLTNIYYNNPEIQSDTIKAFVGVALSDTTAPIPADYKIRVIAGSKKVLQVTINAHFLLAPNKLYPALFEYLKVNKLEAIPPYLEQFPEKDFAILRVKTK